MRIINNRRFILCLLLILDVNAEIHHKYCLEKKSGILKKFNPDREICDDGNVVSKATTEPPTPPPTTTPTTTRTKAAPSAATAAAAASNNRCGLSAEKIEDGYRCCAYDAYNPEYQTCCVESLWKYLVHDDKPAKSHVCCSIHAHKRNEAPCRRNPGNNDKFWDTVMLGDAGPTISQLYKYAFSVKVEEQENVLGKYIASVGQIYPYSRKSPISPRQMPIPTDEYSPKTDLAGQTFVILSNTNHLASRFLDIFLDSNDKIFKVSEWQEKFQKIVRKAFRRCERRDRKRHQSKKRGRKRLLNKKGKRPRRS